jgi:hypothetical protein
MDWASLNVVGAPEIDRAIMLVYDALLGFE